MYFPKDNLLTRCACPKSSYMEVGVGGALILMNWATQHASKRKIVGVPLNFECEVFITLFFRCTPTTNSGISGHHHYCQT